MHYFLLILFLIVSPWIHGTWADDELATMTLREKIGQLFIVPINLDASESEFVEVQHVIVKNFVGGVIFLHQGACSKQFRWMQKLKSLTKIPMLLCQDAEWGLAMRITDAPSYPKAMTLGALQDEKLIYELGKKIGQDCKAIGIDLNFAPVADVNSNPLNLIIGMRSFGDNPQTVASKACAYLKGMQDGGVLSCAKHFPGHGNMQRDSHIDLPVIEYDKKHLDTLDLIPFKDVIANKVDAIMTGHIHMPKMDSRKNRPASLSYKISTTLLKDELGFDGFLITDALDMCGVTNYFGPGEIAVEAFLAGADLLLCPGDIDLSIQAILQAVQDGIIQQTEIDSRVLKILTLKEKRKNVSEALSYEEVEKIIHSEEGFNLKRTLYEQVITKQADNNNIIPLNSRQHVAVVTIGEPLVTFCQKLKKNISLDLFALSPSAQNDEIQKCAREILAYEIVIFALSIGPRILSSQYSDELFSLIKSQQNSCLVLFGTPYALNTFSSHGATLVAYEVDAEAQRAAALVLSGALPARGALPVTLLRFSPLSLGIINYSSAFY